MDLKEMFPMKLGFGGLRLPTNGSKDDVNYIRMCEMVDEYVANGGNYFDTSFIYHKGKSENAMAACVVDRLKRDSFCLADKLPLWTVGGKTDLEGVFETQLKKCHVDYFDFYILHNMNRNSYDFTEQSDAFEFQQKLKKDGKIRYAGMSFHDTPQMLDKLLTEHKDLDFVQLQINYYDWLSEYVQAKKCYEVAVNHNMPVVVMETVRGGGLCNLPPLANELLKAAYSYGSAASLAIRFAASLDNVFMVLSGMSDLEQVKDNCSYMKPDCFKKLSDEEYEMIDNIVAAMKIDMKVKCSHCGKCNDVCPQKIDISKMISIYNDGEMFGDLNFPEMHYNIHNRANNASSCIRCGSCQMVCPENVEIIDLLREIAGKFDR